MGEIVNGGFAVTSSVVVVPGAISVALAGIPSIDGKTDAKYDHVR